MVIRHPTANIINPILWLGHESGGLTSPLGSGTVININNEQFLATALHVADPCSFNPQVRYQKRWNRLIWQTVGIDIQHDIAVLKSDTLLDSRRIPVKYGEPEGLIYGQIGYALGYPGIGNSVDHIVEANGRPIPLIAIATAVFGVDQAYSPGYINAGFSGGALAFPVGDKDWTIAGIITAFPTVPRPVYNNGAKTGDYVHEHSGLIKYTSINVVKNIINKSNIVESETVP